MADSKSLKNLTTAIYALYAASLLIGITAIVAIIMNYVKKEDVVGTLFESHFRWQIRTFWFSLLWGLLGWMLVGVVIGRYVLVAAGVWTIYRIARGWVCLNENRPMYAD